MMLPLLPLLMGGGGWNRGLHEHYLAVCSIIYYCEVSSGGRLVKFDILILTND